MSLNAGVLLAKDSYGESLLKRPRVVWLVVFALLASVLVVFAGGSDSASAAPPASISGKVFGAGTPAVPLQSAIVLAYGAGGFEGFASTDASGSFNVTGLAAGSYALSFGPPYPTDYLPQWYGDQPTQATAVPVTVAAGQSLTVKDTVLALGGSISGVLTDSAGTPIAAGHPNVVVYHAGGGVDQTSTYVQRTTVAQDGSYTMHGLPLGTYKVGFTSNSSGISLSGSLAPSDPYVSQWYQGKYSYSSGDVVSVNTGGQQVSGISALLENPTFADVSDPSNAFYAPIQWMASTGLSTGTAQPAGKPLYKPVSPVSREAMAAFLYRLSKKTFVPPVTPSFADVGTSSPFYTAVEWMASRGISTGTAQPSGKPLFKPSDPVSRQAMALFLARYDHIDVSQPPTSQFFADVDVNAFGAAAIGWMGATGISTGTAQPSGQPLYKPLDPVSRQAMATFLYRLAHLAT